MAIFLYFYHLFDVVYWTSLDTPFSITALVFALNRYSHMLGLFVFIIVQIFNSLFVYIYLSWIVNVFIFNNIQKYGIFSRILNISTYLDYFVYVQTLNISNKGV